MNALEALLDYKQADEDGVMVLASRQAIHEVADALEQWRGAMHASAPEGHKCSDCTIDEEPCPTCYTSWWQKRHPNHHEIVTEIAGAHETL